MSGDFQRVMDGLEGLFNELSGDSSVDLEGCGGEDVHDLIKKSGSVIALLGHVISNALNCGAFSVGEDCGPTDEEWAEMNATRAGEPVS